MTIPDEIYTPILGFLSQNRRGIIILIISIIVLASVVFFNSRIEKTIEVGTCLRSMSDKDKISDVTYKA